MKINTTNSFFVQPLKNARQALNTHTIFFNDFSDRFIPSKEAEEKGLAKPAKVNMSKLFQMKEKPLFEGWA
jgi:hypothetical protein